MKFVGIVATLLIVLGAGCTSLQNEKVLKHKIVTLDNEITRAESVKNGILSHAYLEGKQDTEEVVKAIAGVDAYIAKLKVERKDSQAILDSRATPTP